MNNNETSQQPGCSQASVQSSFYSTPSSAKKRKRTARASIGQIEALVAKLEAAPFLATRRFSGMQGRENFDSGWRALAGEINSLPGSEKTAEQWMTFWRDLKSKTSSKAAKFNKDKAQTGNQPIKAAPLSEIERRVLSIIGTEYTLGTGCPDSMPEEEAVQLHLEAAEEHQILISLPENIETDVMAAPITAPTEVVQEAIEPSELVQEPTHQAQRRRNTNLNPRRSVIQQHNEARRDFLAVAESNAQAMRILAEAAKLNAEAAKMQAEALHVLAEGVNKIGDAFKTFIEKKLSIKSIS